MIEQITQTQGSAAGSLGESGKAGEGGAKGGLFATLIASFQKHIKQTEADLNVGEQKTLANEKNMLAGMQKTILKMGSEGVEGEAKAKSLLKVDGANKAAKGEHVENADALVAKSLLQASNSQVLVEENSGQQGVLNTENIIVDDADKLQKDSVIGLGAFQQESRDSMMKKAGDSEAKEGIFAGLEGKTNKNNANGDKSPHLAMNSQSADGQKSASVGQNKTARTSSESLVSESKGAEVTSAKRDSQGRFSLQGMDTLDDGVDVSKLIKRDDVASAKSQAKSAAIEATLKNQAKVEGTAAKTVSLASAESIADEVKVTSSDGLNKGQSKQVKDSQIQQGLDSAEKVSKVKSSFKAAAANRSGVLGTQAQASISAAASAQGDAVVKSSGGQDANMAGDERGTGRSAAELLMSDGSVRDIRSTRSEFAMQMAYRSAASFKPSDAMLEISKAAKDGSVKLELMLEPATLGKIQVTLQTDAQKQIQVHLIVDQQSSRQVLEQQLPQLRQALADQGLNLSGFTMDMNSQQQNDGKSSHDMAGTGHMNGHAELEDAMSLQTPLRMGVNVADDGSLSILA